MQFYYNSQNPVSSIQFYEFPFKAIVRQLCPDLEIAYLTFNLQTGSPYSPEETLFFKIIVEAENSGDNSICQFYSMPLEVVGYSGNAIYNNFHPTVGVAYLRMPFVVTTIGLSRCEDSKKIPDGHRAARKIMLFYESHDSFRRFCEMPAVYFVPPPRAM